MIGEHELGDILQRLPPAGDLGGLPGIQHVAGLRGRGGFAGDRVDAVHRQHHQHALAGGIGQAYGVAVAGLAGHPTIAAMRIAGQPLAGVAVDDRHVHQRPGLGAGAGGQREQRGKQEQAGAEHGGSPEGTCVSTRRRRGWGLRRQRLNWPCSDFRKTQ